jgi:hypothetical protein
MVERKKFKVKSLGATPGLQLRNISTKHQLAQKAPVQTISTNSSENLLQKSLKGNIKAHTKLLGIHCEKYST